MKYGFGALLIRHHPLGPALLIKPRKVAIQLLASIWWSAPVSAGEVEIIDGDTLSVSGAHHRIFGIDAPEQGQVCENRSGEEWSCGKSATMRLKKLVRGQTVVCDPKGMDDYDRYISVCLAGEIEIGKQLVEEGVAWAFRKYSLFYGEVEDVAKAKMIGIWQAENTPPWEFRAQRWEFASQSAPPGCPIKGNITDNGKIYHAPWSPWYDRTKISEERGERWFCSEREALDAGWRAPRWGS